MVLNKRSALLILGMVLMTNIFSQTYYKFAVYFRDKNPAGYPYSLSSPNDFLSQRSIDRRTRYNIPYTSRDLPVAQAYIDSVLNISDSISFYNKSKWMNLVVVGMSDSNLVNFIEAMPCVSKVEFIYKGGRPLTRSNGTIPVGPLGTPQPSYGLNYGTTSTQNEMLSIDYLHRKGDYGKGMIIAVLDAGFTNVNVINGFNHLRDSSRILGTWDFVKNEASVWGDNSHGTAVLSCMAGYIPGDFLGTAPEADYWLLRSEEADIETVSEEYNWMAAAEFADSAGADIINSSLGYTTFDIPSMNHTYADLDGNTTIITQAADMAAATGMLICNSAGNSGNTGWHYIGAPADGDSVLTIGAVQGNRAFATFSSYGPAADGDLKPNVCAMGEQAFVFSIFGVPGAGNGTSFSSPILCGAIACLWARHPEKTNLQIMDAVEKSAHKYSDPDDQFGYGIPNFGVADKLLTDTDFSSYFNNQDIRVYPNPMPDLRMNFNFDFYSNVTEDIIVNLVSVRGRSVHTQTIKVYEKSLNTYEVNLEKKMARGVYVMCIYTSQKNFSVKFVVN